MSGSSSLSVIWAHFPPDIIFYRFITVTENEVTHGILESPTSTDSTCLCIWRNIPNIKEHLTEQKAQRFIDILAHKIDEDAERYLTDLTAKKLSTKLPSSNFSKVEVNWEASGANISAESASDATRNEQHVKQHKEYLDEVCREFKAKITELIDKGGQEVKQTYSRLNAEVLQHLHFAQARCEVFEGRDKELNTVREYLGSGNTVPMTVYGQSGCGKTSIVANVFNRLTQWAAKAVSQGKTIFCVVRFLGTTPLSSTLQDVLLSLCEQLADLYGKEWEPPSKFPDLVHDFHGFLQCATRQKPLLLLLDSIDQLSSADNAYSMSWLPHRLPNFVKVIVSTIEEGFPVVGNMREIYETSKAEFVEILPLGQQVGLEIITKWLKMNKRQISASQKELVTQALEHCSLPLYARILCDQILRWRSFDDTSKLHLESTIQGAINKHFENMELKLGQLLVKHSLSYLTSARYGLSEVEMEHVLSLDDILLNDIYQFWKPPVRRIPPLLWTRVRNEISNYVVERSADDLQVLQWYHRQFIQTARLRFLGDSDFKAFIHKNLAEYFSGAWGGGKQKPFQYTEAQKARFKLEGVQSQADRKVPTQLYYTITSQKDIRFNQRKVSEFPLHLYESSQIEDLKKRVFFNYKWLYAKLHGTSSAQGILQEFEYFMSIDKSLQRDHEMRTLIATLQLIRPYINKCPSCLSVELTGRLAPYIGDFPLLTQLIRQCDTYSICPIRPLATCFKVATLGLKQNISIRDTEPWHKGGTLTCDSKFQHMYIIDYDDQGVCLLSTWDIRSGGKISELPVGKVKDPEASDVFFQCFLDKQEENLIALYRKKYYAGMHTQRYGGDGFIDIIRKSDATVIRTIQEHLYKYEFFNSVMYFTENWLGVRFGWKIPLWNLKEDKKIQLTQPHILSSDERKFVLTRSRRGGVRYYEGEDKVVAETHAKSATIRNFETKEHLGELEKSDSMAGVALSQDDTLFLADVTGIIHIYDITRLGEGKLIKPKRTLTVPRNTKIRTIESMKTDEEMQSCRTTLILSHNGKYIICVYQSSAEWEALLWNVPTGKYINRIAATQPLPRKYPSFSCDSETIIMQSETAVTLTSASTGQLLEEYEQNTLIRDFIVSTSEPVIAVLLGKDVSLLSSEPTGDSPIKAAKQKIQPATDSVVTLIPRELVTNHKILPEIKMDMKTGVISEKLGGFAAADLDLLNSARGQRKAALDTWVSPDLGKVVQLHLRVQVVDTKAEEIKYTPKANDAILRVKTLDGGIVINEQVPMPTLHGGFKALELLDGDRVVAEGNKVKLRVNKEVQNHMQVMTIPSVLVVSENRDGKLRRLHRITTYQESVQTVSNQFIATLKKIASDEYVNVYDMESGSLATTHQVEGLCSCIRISKAEDRLFVACKNLNLRTYGNRMFFNPESKVQLRPVTNNKLYAVRDILDFPNCVVVRFAEEGAEGYTLNHYVLVDLVTRKVSPHITAKPSLQDISNDGSLAVDSHLTLFDLKSGQVIQNVNYAKRSPNMQLQIRISADKSKLIFVDKENDSLHIIKIDGKESAPVATCYTHAPLMPSLGGIELRNNGEALVLYEKGHKVLGVFLLMEAESASRPLSYASEMDRALSLMGLDSAKEGD